MFGKATYLILMVIFAGIPALFLWWAHYKFILQYKKLLVKLSFFVFFLALVAENVATKILFTWNYTKEKTLGVWFLGIPLETWIFAYLVFIFLLAPAILVLLALEKNQTPFWQFPLKLFFHQTTKTPPKTPQG